MPFEQLTIDCRDPAALVPFWCLALGYEPAPPPEGHATWADWYRAVGVSEDELAGVGDACDRIVDPAGRGPRIWFQVVPERKAGKNRLHVDLVVSGGRAVPLEQRVEAVEARVGELVAAGATVLRRQLSAGVDHYVAVLGDPEGNEFCVA